MIWVLQPLFNEFVIGWAMIQYISGRVAMVLNCTHGSRQPIFSLDIDVIGLRTALFLLYFFIRAHPSFQTREWPLLVSHPHRKLSISSLLAGTPEAGGWTTREVKRLLRGFQGLSIVCVSCVLLKGPSVMLSVNGL